jgi:hypothetical protein
VSSLGIIHISWAGPEIHFEAGKIYRIEDHPYCGPIFLNAKGDPLDNQPKESDKVWAHVNAWYQQGKKVRDVDGKKWAVYQSPMQAARRAGRAAASLGEQHDR